MNSGCVTSKKTKEPAPIRTFWGNKSECVDFLQNNTQAKSERWLLEALGD